MKTLILIVFLSVSSFARSPDISHRWGGTVAVGRNEPILMNQFNRRNDGQFVFGTYGRYQISNKSGILLGYTRYEWKHSPTAVRIYDLTYLHRHERREWFTPIWGLGAGLVDIANYNVDENLKLGVKARGGMEFVLNDDALLDLVFDYQFVNKMPFERRSLAIGEIHAVSFQAVLTYFFGRL